MILVCLQIGNIGEVSDDFLRDWSTITYSQIVLHRVTHLVLAHSGIFGDKDFATALSPVALPGDCRAYIP